MEDICEAISRPDYEATAYSLPKNLPSMDFNWICFIPLIQTPVPDKTICFYFPSYIKRVLYTQVMFESPIQAYYLLFLIFLELLHYNIHRI
jgi:hypothetical protein